MAPVEPALARSGKSPGWVGLTGSVITPVRPYRGDMTTCPLEPWISNGTWNVTFVGSSREKRCSQASHRDQGAAESIGQRQVPGGQQGVRGRRRQAKTGPADRDQASGSKSLARRRRLQARRIDRSSRVERGRLGLRLRLSP